MNDDSGLAALAAISIRQACPLVLAALGGILSERSGVVNIALEGIMLIGAFVGIWAGQQYGAVQGLLAAIGAGGAVGAAHLVFTQTLRINHIVSGVAINILALNLSTFLLRAVYNQADPPRQARLTEPLPVEWFIGLALAATIGLHVLLYHTVLGLRLRAVGESPKRTRLAYLSMSLVGRFTDEMISGRGFIALAAVICGRWTPMGAVLACCAFGFFDALQLRMQGILALPSEALRALPYALTILAAAAFRSQPPASLGSSDEATAE